MRTIKLVLLAAVAAAVLVVGAGTAAANGGGQPVTKQELLQRAENAVECISRYQTLLKSDGVTHFTSFLDCVIYAGLGGEFGTPPPAGPVITSITTVESVQGCEAVIDGTGFAGTTSVITSEQAYANSVFTVNASGTEIDAYPPDSAAIDGGAVFTVTTPEGSASVVDESQCGAGGAV